MSNKGAETRGYGRRSSRASLFLWIGAGWLTQALALGTQPVDRVQERLHLSDDTEISTS